MHPPSFRQRKYWSSFPRMTAGATRCISSFSFCASGLLFFVVTITWGGEERDFRGLLNGKIFIGIEQMKREPRVVDLALHWFMHTVPT